MNAIAQMSDEELMAIANGGQQAPSVASSMPDEELMKIAGVTKESDSREGKLIPRLTKTLYEGVPFGKRVIGMMPNSEELKKTMESTPEANNLMSHAGNFVGMGLNAAPAIAGSEALIPGKILASSIGFGGQVAGQRSSEGATPLQALSEGAVNTAIAYTGGKVIQKVAPIVGKAIINRVLGPTAEEVGAKVSQTVKQGIEKAVRPSVIGKRTANQQEAYFKKAESAVKDVLDNKPNLEILDKDGVLVVGKNPESLNEALQAVGQTRENIFETYSPMIKKASSEGAVVDGNAIAGKLRSFASQENVQLSNPGLAKYADDVASRWEGKQFTLDVAEQTAKDFNAMLKQKYQQGKVSGADVSSAHVDDMVVRMLRNEIAEKAGVGDLKRRYGALAELESDLAKRAIIAGRQNPIGFVESMANAQSGADIAGAVVMSAVTQNPMWLGLAVRGIGMKAASNIVKGINSPDANIARMFKNVEKLRSIPTRKVITPAEAVNRPMTGRGAVSEAEVIAPESQAVGYTKQGQIGTPIGSRKAIPNMSAEGQGFKSGSGTIPMGAGGNARNAEDVINMPSQTKKIAYQPAQAGRALTEGDVVQGEGFTVSPYSTKEKMEAARRLEQRRVAESKAIPVTKEMQEGVLMGGKKVDVPVKEKTPIKTKKDSIGTPIPRRKGMLGNNKGSVTIPWKDVSSGVKKVSATVPQSIGAGKIPTPKKASREQLSGTYEKLSSIVMGNPERYNVSNKSAIVDNADYGKSFGPCSVCEKGKDIKLTNKSMRNIIDDSFGKEGAPAPVKTAASRKLMEAGLEQGLETTCPTCYEYEKQITGYNAKPVDMARRVYKQGMIDDHVGTIRNGSGVVRMYPVGDFSAEDIPSVIAFGNDLERHGLGAGTYTKNLNMVEIFGDTGIKFNVSTASDIKYGLPVELVESYRKRFPNVATSHVAINEKDLLAAMKDSRIDKIIPVHLGSGTPEQWLSNVTRNDFQNFQNVQSEKVGKELLAKLDHPMADKARKIIREATYTGNKNAYISAVEKASDVLGMEITPKFAKYKDMEGYEKLIGSGRAEFGRKADMPKIDMTKANLDRAEQYVMNDQRDTSETAKAYKRVSDKIIEAAKRGGVDAVNKLNAKMLSAILGIGIVGSAAADASENKKTPIKRKGE